MLWYYSSPLFVLWPGHLTIFQYKCSFHNILFNIIILWKPTLSKLSTHFIVLGQVCVIFVCLPEGQKLTHRLPFTSWQRPIISICWGHRDSRLLMASGPALYVVRVEHRVSSLQLLCQQAIASTLREDKDVSKLTLPPRLCSYLSTAFIPTIKVKPFALFLACFLFTCLPHRQEWYHRKCTGVCLLLCESAC